MTIRAEYVSDYFGRWRVRQHLTIEEAAERLGITVNDVADIEAGKSVSKAVGTTVNYALRYPVTGRRGNKKKRNAD